MSELAANTYVWREYSAKIVHTLSKPNPIFALLEEIVTARKAGYEPREYRAIMRSAALRRVTDGA